jgi:glycosidase
MHWKSIPTPVLSSFFTLFASAVFGQETILQYFNTSWREIERRIPEVAEAGYTSLWLPPPQKGASGGFSVGYDPFDRFDLGDQNQSGSVATRYGTKSDLLRLMETAHRFGLRVYLDNVMAHNGGPLDNVPAGTLFPSIPGFVPEDFHLVRKTGGGWRKANDSIDYSDEWQVLNRNPFAWDIAQENPNTSFDPVGQQEGLDYPKWSGVRHAGKTWLYPDTDLPGVTDAQGFNVKPFADKEPYQDIGYGAGSVGAGNGRFDWQDLNGNGQHDPGEPSEPFTDTGVDPSDPSHQTAAWGYGDGKYNMGNPVAEDVNGMLIRSIRWTIDQTHCDGFRLDAVKHVPSYFFGQQTGDKDPSSGGYLGRAQAQYNLTHGYTDWSNHRNSTYSTNAVRDDLMLFGEHLGAPPNPNDYLAAGMRIANDDFVNNVGGFNGIGSNMTGFDSPGVFTFGVSGGVMYCLSHDNNYMAASERPAAHQYMLTRAGVPIVYTDGYNVSGGPDYFPKPSYTPFLGQYGQTFITGTLPVRRDFMRGDQWPRWSSQNFCAWEFRDYSENPSMSDADATTLVVMHARNYTSGQQMPFGTAFPSGARLRNYGPFGGAFYATVGNDGRLRGDGDPNPVAVPSGGYFAFSYDVPDLPDTWQGSSQVHAIDIFESGVQVPTIGVLRKDGRDGDPAYNYTVQIPLVRSSNNLRFVARADGSATNILIKLDGGLDLNSQMNPTGQTPFTVGRDNQPGSSVDTFLGYEQMRFVHRVSEKFAAQIITNPARDIIGSPGAETWECTIGTAGFILNQGGGVTTNIDTADWVYHNPGAADINGTTQTQFSPAPAGAAGQAITVWTKIGYKADGVTNAWLYYTTDGTTYPEGSAGLGGGTTQVIPLTYNRDGTADGTGTPEWWRGTIPALPSGTRLRYKIGAYKSNAASRFPDTADQISKKKKMETLFEIANFDAAGCTVYPHNDLGERFSGLREGFHVLRSRAFLSHSGKASLFRTNTQTFYYDTQRPAGQIRFPAEGGTIGGTTYGFVVLTDASVTDVQFNILDSNVGNDSTVNGNGAGNWAAAQEVTPTQLGGTGFVREWRFDYKNIPTSGAAIVNVRLREVSSAGNDTLSDTAGWFTTLTRNVNTGNAVNYRIQFPGADGTVVDTSYVAKVYFDKSLGFNGGNPIDPAQMVSEFTVLLDGTLIPRSGYTFIRDETGIDSALAFHFPTFYSGNPDDLHELRATHQRGDISLTDIRLVKAAPGAIADSDGDGLPDYWEVQNRLDANNPDGEEGALGDKDHDGLTNAIEFLADLNPEDPNDGPNAITPKVSRIGTTAMLTFPVIPNRRYQVQTSSDLATWSNAGASFTVPSANAAYQWTDPSPISGGRFYRLQLSLP